MTDRPVDRLPKPPSFRFTRKEALVLGCCARCGRDVDPSRFDHLDAMEYAISALCAECFDEITVEADCGA